MARPKAETPSLRRHKTGQAFVTVNRRDFYLGTYGSPESLAKYAVLVKVYQESGYALPDGFSVKNLNQYVPALLQATAKTLGRPKREPVRERQLVLAFKAFADVRYASHQGDKTRSKLLCQELEAMFGAIPVAKFGPLALQELRKTWIASGKSRKYCNRLTGAVVRMFKWGVSQELVTTATWQALTTVEPLREGYTEAKEREPVRPVPVDHVRATVPYLSPVVRAMVRVQLATGMRPSEVFNMRPADIDRSQATWIYRPRTHKTKTRGKDRAVPIMGEAREAIEDYMNRSPESFMFSPAESEAWHRSQWRAARAGGGSRKPKADNPQRKPGLQFKAGAYGVAIARAAKRAGVPKWTPYQLRHTAGTIVRDKLGPEAAQALLGHANIQMTEHYAKVSEAKAIEAAKHAPKL